METATEQRLKADSEVRNQMIFENMMEDFFKRWAPDDPREKSQFHAQLASIIRQVYHDAQEPVFKQLTAIARCLPMSVLK